MISISGLCVSFDNNPVLKKINVDFEQGLIHGIVGLNGAGKSTFFNVLAKSIRPDSGKLLIGKNAITIRDTAYLETVNYFFKGITGTEYLKIFTQTNADFKLSVLQDYFKLPLNELVENYSTGMKKKLALLGILKQDRPVFLMDEPFNGLDLETNKIVEIIITTLQEKQKTIFVSSHIIEPLFAVCDKIHLLENGTFSKYFDKKDFDEIDNELFAKLKYEAREVISGAL